MELNKKLLQQMTLGLGVLLACSACGSAPQVPEKPLPLNHKDSASATNGVEIESDSLPDAGNCPACGMG